MEAIGHDEALALKAALAATLIERDEAREEAHYATGVAKLAMKHRDTAEAALGTVRKALLDLLELLDERSM